MKIDKIMGTNKEKELMVYTTAKFPLSASVKK